MNGGVLWCCVQYILLIKKRLTKVVAAQVVAEDVVDWVG